WTVLATASAESTVKRRRVEENVLRMEGPGEGEKRKSEGWSGHPAVPATAANSARATAAPGRCPLSTRQQFVASSVSLQSRLSFHVCRGQSAARRRRRCGLFTCCLRLRRAGRQRCNR